MDSLIEYSDRKIRYVDNTWKRYLYEKINWQDPLIMLTGPRGIGKTTLLLQSLRERKDLPAIYLSLDDIYFTEQTLTNTIDHFYKLGITHFYLDEVHKYPTWAIEVKNASGMYPGINLVLAGSSALRVMKDGVDLNERISGYRLHGLSFREYLSFEEIIRIPPVSLHTLLEDHRSLSNNILGDLKPLKHFNEYLEYGYYPFFAENRAQYHEKIRNITNILLEYDLSGIVKLEYINIFKLKKLLKIISDSVPFKPNISELASKLEINRSYIYHFLEILEKTGLISLLYQGDTAINRLNKPEKIFLNNTNLIHALTPNTNSGNPGKTFFLNQLIPHYQLHHSDAGDFLINNEITFEVGGKNELKTPGNVNDVSNYYLALDQIETGSDNTIPLWMFGLLY